MAQPEAIALQCGQSALTYGELDGCANQLARRLRSLGVKPQSHVALFLERSLDMVVAIVAVLKAGATYVPIDLAYPKERAQFMLEDSSPVALVTQSHLLPRLAGTPAVVICLDQDAPALLGESSEPLDSGACPSSAAYIIYTSGSTGKPKGVIVTHENVVRLLTGTEHWYGFNGDDVWTLFHSYAFDVSVWEIWGALFYGGRLVVVPYLTSRSPAALYELLAAEGVTVLCQTPSAFRQLIWAEAGTEARGRLKLRYVILAGEALELKSLKPWFDLHGDDTPLVVNMYGITETTVHTTYRPIRRSDLARGARSVIGVPLPDLQIHLLDEQLKPVPRGEPGEICVGGPGVARGYLNRPELTQARFIPDRFSNVPGATLYRSGDLARETDDGDLEYLGRMDQQVKIRGFRIELGEIEAALNQHPAIRESAVVARPGNAGDRRLVAYFVPRAATPDTTDLREHLSRTLPDYMVPAGFVPMKGFPLTINGKIDLRALPEPARTRPELRTACVAPGTETEKTLARVWSEVLEIEGIGVHDRFYDLGGDSIRSISILSKAQKAGLSFSLQQMFANPTIAALAAQARPASEDESAEPEPFSLIAPQDRQQLPADAQDAYPVTELQLGMFYYNELDPVSAVYHDIFSFRIQARLVEAALRQAVEELQNRHPILRTSFHLTGYSVPLQVVHRSAPAPITFEDLRLVDEAAQQRRLGDWVEDEKRRPFDRSRAPLVRFHVQHLADQAFQCVISFHHSCLDGWSLAAVMTEMLQAYASILADVSPEVPAPRVAYRDFVKLERDAIASEECRGFWASRLKDVLPQTLPRWPKAYCEGGHEQKRGPELRIDDETFAGLRRLAEQAGVPLKSVLVAAHQKVIATLSAQSDIVSGLIMNGRPERIDGERLAGLFLNALPLRQQLSGGSWIDLARDCFAVEQEMMPHRRLPLAQIQRLNGGAAIFESAFDFVHFHVYRSLEGCNLNLSEGHYFEANNLTTYTTFMLDVNSASLQLHIDYNPNLVAREQAAQISQYYVSTLRQMAARPEEHYECFSPLSPSEIRRQLVEWNATGEVYPRHSGLHELFEERTQEAPNAVALVFNGRPVTRRELNRQANQTAHTLRQNGVGAGALVGICLERGPAMVAALLGILKAGGAYVPLDPAFPPKRLEQIIADAGLKVILTQPSLIAQLGSSGARLLLAETDIASSDFDQDIPGPTAGNSLAYVIYTSGSTGTPKGVEIRHRSVVNLLFSAARVAGITPQDNLLAVTTISFDIAALEIFTPLIIGGRLTLSDRETAADGTRLAALLRRSGATVLQATPATWRLLIESGWKGEPRLKILCGGEPLKLELAAQLLRLSGEVWNFYGPTETTIWSTAAKVRPGMPISIGRPLANTRVYVLDAQMRPVPPGVVGELHIGGDGLARGYWNRPDLTALQFVPDPFSAEGRLYKTGDLARQLPDGNLECLGRLDHQLKIRGFRIEPAEIESALKTHHGVRDALVHAREDSTGTKKLVGYLTPRNGGISVAELREHLLGTLPFYMVPAQFVLLPEFPLTPNGKIDLRKLPNPDGALAQRANYVAPGDSEEKALAQIWMEVLDLKKVGIDDHFFEIGGDSLSATRAFARINRTFATDLTLSEILAHPTIRALAPLVRSSRGIRSGAPVIPRRSGS